MNKLLNGILVALVSIGLFLVVVVVTIVIKEVVLKPETEVHQLGEFECESDCKQMPDFSVECQCHPIRK